MQKTYRRNYAVAVAGMLAGTVTPRVRSLKNASDNTYEIWTIAIPASPTNNTTYSITADDNGAAATTDASANQAELADLLLKAVRMSVLYDIFNPTLNTSTFVLTLTVRKQSTPVAVTASSGLTATRIVAATTASPVPFGVVVGRKVGDPSDVARLLSATTDVPKGITLLTHAIEKNGIGQAAVTAYYPGEMMDVVDRVNQGEGIWTQCVESSGISEDDPVYVNVTGVNAGKVTRSASGAVALPRSKFVSEINPDYNGKSIIKVSINFD